MFEFQMQGVLNKSEILDKKMSNCSSQFSAPHMFFYYNSYQSQPLWPMAGS